MIDIASRDRIRRALLGFMTILATTSCSLIAPQRDPLPEYTGQPRNMLMLEMSNANRSIQSLFEEACFNNPNFNKRFQLIDRNSLELLLKEQQLAGINALDESGISKYGKQLGAQVFMKSELLSLETSSRTDGSAKYGYYTTYLSNAMVSIKLVDIETGKVLGLSRGSGSSSSSRSTEQLKIDALSRAIDNAVYEVLKSYSKVYG